MRKWRKTKQTSRFLLSVPSFIVLFSVNLLFENIFPSVFWTSIFHLKLRNLCDSDAVHGIEFAFGAHEYPSTGIFEGEPKQCDGFKFRRSILIGKTDLSQAEVRSLMEELGKDYRGNAYNLITKNCNHFCNQVCIKLTGNSIPSWVNRLARIGKIPPLFQLFYQFAFPFLFLAVFSFSSCNHGAKNPR